MDRTRKLAASPVRPAHAAWSEVKNLVAATLEQSNQVPDGSVAAALSPVDGLAASLVAAGYFATEPCVVLAGDLRLNIYAIGGDDAFAVEENLDPVPGGGNAPATWKMYVPSPKHLRETMQTACDGHVHLVSGKAPALSAAASVDAPAASTKGFPINPDALRQLGGRL